MLVGVEMKVVAGYVAARLTYRNGTPRRRAAVGQAAALGARIAAALCARIAA